MLKYYVNIYKILFNIYTDIALSQVLFFLINSSRSIARSLSPPARSQVSPGTEDSSRKNDAQFI